MLEWHCYCCLYFHNRNQLTLIYMKTLCIKHWLFRWQCTRTSGSGWWARKWLGWSTCASTTRAKHCRRASGASKHRAHHRAHYSPKRIELLLCAQHIRWCHRIRKERNTGVIVWIYDLMITLFEFYVIQKLYKLKHWILRWQCTCMRGSGWAARRWSKWSTIASTTRARHCRRDWGANRHRTYSEAY